MSGLYTFNKKVWFVRFLDWAYEMDTVSTFKTFCPVFWLLVFTLLFTIIPIIPLFKLFGKWGTKVLNSARLYRQRKREELQKQFQEKYSEATKLTNKECYYIVKSKCWDDYKYELTSEQRDALIDKGRFYRDALYEQQQKKKKEREVKYDAIKESAVFTFFSVLIAGTLLLTLCYVLFMAFCSIRFDLIDWYIVGLAFLALTGLVILVFLITLFVKHVIPVIADKISCIKWPKCQLCKLPWAKIISWPFVMLFKGLAIICDMIYSTYKQRCPVITWKDKN